jgi:hypothetical protein
VPSLNFPIAVNCILVPSPNLVSGVVSVREDSFAVETVRVGAAVAFVLINFALIVVVPADKVVVRPDVGLPATEVVLELQAVAGVEVTSWTLKSLNSALALN